MESDVIPGFGSDPIWLVIAKANVTFVFLVLMVLFSITFERKWVGWMQHRVGPNRTGPWGLLQALADGVKLMFKEDITPTKVDKLVFIAAPIISTIPAIVAFSTIPMGPTVSVFGHHTNLQMTDLPVGVLVIFACSSLGVYGIVLSGWASGSTYPLLGALRSSAQMISYEVAMGLSMVAVFLYAESMSTSQIVASQSQTWNIFPLFVSFVIYAIAIVGETNRAPFDLPEAESEIVGGFHTEYSSMKFAMFFLAEYINIVTVSALCTTLFLGGWHAPWGLVSIWSGANSGWWPILWFTGKVIAIIFVFVWLRGTLPRLRYDQFMALGWKVLLPINLGWILAVASMKVLTDERVGWSRQKAFIVVVLPVIVVIVFVAIAMDAAAARKKSQQAQEDEADAKLGPSFPVPPMDLVVPKRRPLVSAGARKSLTKSTDEGDADNG